MLKRLIEQRIRADFGKGKAIVVLEPRQVGKTTLLGQLVAGQEKVLSFNCDNSDDREDSQGTEELLLGQRRAQRGHRQFLAAGVSHGCGALWENYLAGERLKRNAYSGRAAKGYFGVR